MNPRDYVQRDPAKREVERRLKDAHKAGYLDDLSKQNKKVTEAYREKHGGKGKR